MKMQTDELPHIKTDLDYTQIPPIQQKRIIAFVNHFITNTVSYLNTFCQSCESRFMQFEYKVQKIEASLLILESQLSSIPGFNGEQSPSNANESPKVPQSETLALPELVDKPVSVDSVQENVTVNNEANQAQQEPVGQTGVKASEDPRFAKFFKMLKVGVQAPAVKLQMKAEGVDPAVLDNPDAVIPDV
ncbi:WASH complex subunit 3 [Dendroctonus ponderosae]|uniref:WASH complex subunit 3 n=1 Tax=Dendroctonus ponderosae TaxID=77166 RepID=U4TVB1_DENPD|nr:WASH complex subunit 3 [Dendroctonus ponderosae]ERL85509.1 hypothetical protein D910_02928 [Dendroctonus ponderosae]